MNKLKKIYNFIKEKLQNKRTRAATLLVLYLIFFVFVIMFLKNSPKNVKDNIKETTVKNNYSNIQEEYEYEYDIDIKREIGGLKFLFTGTKTKENQTEKVELYNEETGRYEEAFDYEIINPLLLNLDTIISYVNNIESEFSTNYKDNTVQNNYLVPINKIDENINSKELVEINIYKKDNFINKIIIDATNIDKLSDEEIINSKYTLNYKKIEK